MQRWSSVRRCAMAGHDCGGLGALLSLAHTIDYQGIQERGGNRKHPRHTGLRPRPGRNFNVQPIRFFSFCSS
jgi:hypothetical protein